MINSVTAGPARSPWRPFRLTHGPRRALRVLQAHRDAGGLFRAVGVACLRGKRECKSERIADVLDASGDVLGHTDRPAGYGCRSSVSTLWTILHFRKERERKGHSRSSTQFYSYRLQPSGVLAALEGCQRGAERSPTSAPFLDQLYPNLRQQCKEKSGPRGLKQHLRSAPLV